MLEHSVYSVISPEGCASILWRDAAQAPVAAEALRLTATDLHALRIVDTVDPRARWAAPTAMPAAAVAAVGAAVQDALAPVAVCWSPAALLARRREKFLAMGRDLPA